MIRNPKRLIVTGVVFFRALSNPLFAQTKKTTTPTATAAPATSSTTGPKKEVKMVYLKPIK